MSTLSWRKAGSSSALALSLVVGLPALAQAQLFPNMWIQRERTPCPNEPPFYAHIRHNYYGYFPTCWRKFPEGWACPCPNPEIPDAAASFRQRPRDPKPELPPPESIEGGAPLGGMAPDLGPGPGPGPGTPRRGDADIPPLPRSISPLNDGLGAPGGRDANPAQPTPGRGNQPEPRDPFEPTKPAIPRSAGPGASLRMAPPAGDGPALEPPAGESTSVQPASASDSLAVAGRSRPRSARDVQARRSPDAGPGRCRLRSRPTRRPSTPRPLRTPSPHRLRGVPDC